VNAARGRRVLTINCGSSSLKAAVYRVGAEETRLFQLVASRIGGAGSRLSVAGHDGARLFDGEQRLPDYQTALDAMLGWIKRSEQPLGPEIVAHRVVHGGTRYREPTLVTGELLEALERLVPVDPDHMPQAIAAIRALGEAYPALRQVACFDTGFHRAMPAVARTYPLPRRLAAGGAVRYGFHGLSYEYVVQELRRLEGAAASGRVIVAHLGNGASLAAIREGQSMDTTMGFSPAGGLMMGTRCGDLDPGLVVYLLRRECPNADQLDDLINEQSGLLAVSETSEDMRDLLEREPTDPRAAEAVALFCYQTTKYLGACAAALSGLDLLVFTAGIGEHAAPVRERICAPLGFLGLELDPARNQRHEPVISRDTSQVKVRIVPTNEELMVARHASRFVT
jgi:acetate kinase